MNKPWKQIKVFVSDNEQSILIEPTPERDGVCIDIIEEDSSKKSFRAYMTLEECKLIGREMINFAQEIELNK